LVRQPLTRLNRLLLPCIILLDDNQACLLETLDSQQQTVQLRLPELDMQLQQLSLAELNARYSGIALYCHPSFRLAAGQLRTAAEPEHKGHWFWSVIRANRQVYTDVLLAAFFI